MGRLNGRCSVPVFDDAYTALDASGQLVLHNVKYEPLDSGMEDVCSGPRVHNIVWVNNTALDPSLPPGSYTALRSSFSAAGGGNKCAWMAAEPFVEAGGSEEERLIRYGAWCVPTENPSNGLTHFDNILWAFLTIFQCMTMTDWVFVMYDTQVRPGMPRVVYQRSSCCPYFLFLVGMAAPYHCMDCAVFIECTR